VSNLDGQNPDFDGFTSPGEEMPHLELTAESLGELAAEQPVVTAQAEEGQLPTVEQPKEEAAKKKAARTLGKLPFPLEWGVLVAVPAIILVLVLLQVVYPSTAVYLISVGLVAFGVWKGRGTNTIYTVLLGCALVAILTALYCLWAELGRYHFEIRAKQQSSISAPVQAGSLAETGTRRISPSS
jgi:hypothetical protein